MGLADRYRQAQHSYAEIVRTLGDDELAAPSPCTPGWTVRDLLSHVAGVSIDIVEGNVEGAATDPWTAVQVERWRDTPVDELLDRWDATIEQAGTGIEFIGERRPIFDCHTHEHDMRCALGRPGNRESELMTWITDQFAEAEFTRPIRFEFTDDTALTSGGDGESITLAGLTRFELFRARLGRRSAAQVRGWDWSEPPSDDLLAAWFVFGPAATDIAE